MNVERDPVFGCLLFVGRRDKDGYGLVPGGCFYRRAHLVAFERANGPIPEGMQVDHVCRRRACCNPEHLELVSKSINELRKKWRHRARRTKCKRGHDMNTNAIVTPEGGRVCRACVRGEK